VRFAQLHPDAGRPQIMPERLLLEGASFQDCLDPEHLSADRSRAFVQTQVLKFPHGVKWHSW
jgi:hypothetical protein